MRNDDENNPRFPSWSEDGDVGKCFYVMAAIWPAIWLFLTLFIFFND